MTLLFTEKQKTLPASKLAAEQNAKYAVTKPVIWKRPVPIGNGKLVKPRS